MFVGRSPEESELAGEEVGGGRLTVIGYDDMGNLVAVDEMGNIFKKAVKRLKGGASWLYKKSGLKAMANWSGKKLKAVANAVVRTGAWPIRKAIAPTINKAATALAQKRGHATPTKEDRRDAAKIVVGVMSKHKNPLVRFGAGVLKKIGTGSIVGNDEMGIIPVAFALAAGGGAAAAITAAALTIGGATLLIIKKMEDKRARARDSERQRISDEYQAKLNAPGDAELQIGQYRGSNPNYKHYGVLVRNIDGRDRSIMNFYDATVDGLKRKAEDWARGRQINVVKTSNATEG